MQLFESDDQMPSQVTLVAEPAIAGAPHASQLRIVSLSALASSPLPAGLGGGISPSSISSHMSSAQSITVATLWLSIATSLPTTSKFRSAGAPMRASPIAPSEWQRPLEHLVATSVWPS